MAEDGSSKPDSAAQSSAAPADPERSFRDVRYYVPQDILDVSFPASVRGYDRRAVDAYVKRVNRVIAEVKVSASPPAAVRHALDQAQEKVEGLLQAARDAAAEITSSARQEAEENSARTKAEAADLMVNTSAEADRVKAEAEALLANARAEAEAAVARAKSDADAIVSKATANAEETRARAEAEAEERRQQQEQELASLHEQAQARLAEIKADTEAIRTRRSQLLVDLHGLADDLVDLAGAAEARGRPESPVAADEPSRTPTSEDVERDGEADGRGEAGETATSSRSSG